MLREYRLVALVMGLLFMALMSSPALAQWRRYQAPTCTGPGCPQPSTWAQPGIYQPVPEVYLSVPPPAQMTRAEVSAVPVVEVVHVLTDPDTTWTFRVNGRTIGTFDEITGLFEAVNGHRWEFHLETKAVTKGLKQADSPNIHVGQLVGQMPPSVPPGGIDASKLRPDGEHHYRINGREVTEQSAFEALASNSQLMDDSDFVRLSVIGTDSDRRQVMADIKSDPTLKELSQKLLVNEYQPDAWEIKNLGFRNNGHPTIYLQRPDGKVLHRQDDYQGGKARLVTAIRRARPDYDPEKDPDLSARPLRPKDPPKEPQTPPVNPKPDPNPVSPPPAPPSTPVNVPTWILVVAAGLMAYLFGRKDNSNANRSANA